MEQKFYVKMDDEEFGPYTKEEILSLKLLPDSLVSMDILNTWLPYSTYNLEEKLQACTEEKVGNIQEESKTTTFKEEKESYGNNEVEIKGWNWGAFVFNSLWGLFNGVYWPIVVNIIVAIPTFCLVNEVFIAMGQFINLIVCIILGIKGNELSWNSSKKWKSVEEFKRVQKKWSKAVLWWLIIAVLLILVPYLIVESRIFT
ncbi:MAG: DUF2628 domain-containing protein [Paludibacteraceae bacterium]|nr:DUF2628 domain-containing protein [Paludibacteraceae bacterium]